MTIAIAKDHYTVKAYGPDRLYEWTAESGWQARNWFRKMSTTWHTIDTNDHIHAVEMIKNGKVLHKMKMGVT